MDDNVVVVDDDDDDDDVWVNRQIRIPETLKSRAGFLKLTDIYLKDHNLTTISTHIDDLKSVTYRKDSDVHQQHCIVW